MNVPVHDLNRRRTGLRDGLTALRVLDALDGAPAITQREISRRVGISIGLTNLLLRRMAQKAWIKLRTVPGRRVLYALTPRGLEEKARRTLDFVRLSYRYYQGSRRRLVEAFRADGRPGRSPRVLCYGSDDLLDLVREAVREAGGRVVAIVEDGPDRTPRNGRIPVVGLKDAPLSECDVAVLLRPAPRDVRERWSASGVSLIDLT